MPKKDSEAPPAVSKSQQTSAHLRSDLIQQVQSGAMTPEDAEAEAERLGIAPLLMQPDPAQFDPMNEVVWTLPMVAAWRAFRDVDAVRAWSPAYRSQLREWQPRFCTVTERIIGRDLVKAQSATLLNMATAYELDDNGIPPVSITAVMQCVKAAGMNGGLRATGISTRTGKRRVITRDEWQDLEYKQIGFETNARDVLRMKTDGKWLEHGFDAVTFSRGDVLSGLPAPGAEQGAGPSPSFKRRGRKAQYDWTEAQLVLTAALNQRGDFNEPDQMDDWNCRACAERLVKEHFAKKGQHPTESLVRSHVTKICEQWRADRADHLDC